MSVDPNPSNSVPVLVHPSQFPEALERVLLASLETRRMDHQFHYQSPKQTNRWLRIHEAFSPARRDPSAEDLYRQGAEQVANEMRKESSVDVVSLGCGGGQKDAALIRSLRSVARHIGYLATDASVGLSLVARAAGLQAGAAPSATRAMVLDLGGTPDWNGAFGPLMDPSRRRIVLFFGMLPNFTPDQVSARLAALIRPGDLLLVSANLAPGPDYEAGVHSILPLYDNAPTAEWLRTTLTDLGAERDDGRIEFSIRPCPEGSSLSRIEADFVFERPTTLKAADREFRFNPGERFRLFFSYRHTPSKVASLFQVHGLAVGKTWTNNGGDEGVFLLRRD